ncbi:MAG: hypothetical protein V7739_03105 [Motiliproteus sp.]
MIIRILPSLNDRQQWIEFCRREAPYCFVEQPDTLVDFQSTHLVITLLNKQVRNGKEAVKYSIGSRQSVEPAWHFIKACRFSLEHMVQGLEDIEFMGNVRDNSHSGFIPDVNIRQFFAKEQAVISPAFLGELEPLSKTPEHWELHQCCRLLANGQFQDLRFEKKALNGEYGGAPDPQTLLISLVEKPDHWRIRLRDSRLWLINGKQPLYSLVLMLGSVTARPSKRLQQRESQYNQIALKQVL